MEIEKILIKNYKIYQNLNIDNLKKNNILIGNNGAGKSTFLQALFLTLTGRLDSQTIDHSISANLFTKQVRQKYIHEISEGNKPILPKILIEIYFKDEDKFAHYKGQENTLNVDLPGISMCIDFDEKFESDYQDRLKTDDQEFVIHDIPTEYYSVQRKYFNGDWVIQRKNPFKVFFVDGTKKSYANYIGRFVYDSLSSMLTTTEISQIKSVYSGIRQNMKNHKILNDLNTEKKDSLVLADSQLSITIKDSLPDDWLNEITVNVNEHPFDNIGFGLQKMIEMELAVEKNSENDGVLLFEEPENNLSYSNMSKLINLIEKNENKQKFISTHSSFVANKIGLNDLMLCENGAITPFGSIPSGSFKYFKKLPGYNTLRLLLSEKVVLVEGPTDELVFNKAFMDQEGTLPINQGIDVIVVDSLAFKRYLDIALQINKSVAVIIDNDGNIDSLLTRYKDYDKDDLIHLFYEKDEKLKTIEPSFIHANFVAGKISTLKEIINISGHITLRDNNDLLNYMTNNKAEWALRIFDSDRVVSYPEYINEAIEYVKIK